MRIHGCTVHFVTAETDAGPVIAQAAVPVLTGDSESDLAARVLKAEHELYPLALRLVAEGKVRMEGGRTIFADIDASARGRSLIVAGSWQDERPRGTGALHAVTRPEARTSMRRCFCCAMRSRAGTMRPSPISTGRSRARSQSCRRMGAS